MKVSENTKYAVTEDRTEPEGIRIKANKPVNRANRLSSPNPKKNAILVIVLSHEGKRNSLPPPGYTLYFETSILLFSTFYDGSRACSRQELQEQLEIAF